MNYYTILKPFRPQPALYPTWGLLIIAISLLLSSCGPKGINFSILPAGVAVQQGNLANNKVDVLWVIDNSGSMLTKQQNLATSFDSFTQIFLNRNFDFHMAIVTTDIRSATDPNPLLRGQQGDFQGAPSVITPSTANFSSVFKANIVVGALGDPAAKSLDAIILSLGVAKLAGSNTGFLRSDAHLAVIFVSDADDDDSVASVSDTVSFLNTLKPDVFDVTSRTYKKNFTASAVVVDTSNTGNAACPMPFEDGVKFKQIAAQTNGSIASICENDFSSGLLNISQNIAAAITEIPLGRVPNVSTIQVLFNGITISNDSTNGWTYSSTGNKIVFHGNAIPFDQTSIQVNFIPADIIR